MCMSEIHSSVQVSSIPGIVICTFSSCKETGPEEFLLPGACACAVQHAAKLIHPAAAAANIRSLFFPIRILILTGRTPSVFLLQLFQHHSALLLRIPVLGRFLQRFFRCRRIIFLNLPGQHTIRPELLQLLPVFFL